MIIVNYEYETFKDAPDNEISVYQETLTLQTTINLDTDCRPSSELVFFLQLSVNGWGRLQVLLWLLGAMTFKLKKKKNINKITY